MSSANQQYRISFQIENALNAANQIRQVGDAMTQTDAKFKTGKTGVDQAGQSLAQFSQRIVGVTAPLSQAGNAAFTYPGIFDCLLLFLSYQIKSIYQSNWYL